MSENVLVDETTTKEPQDEEGYVKYGAHNYSKFVPYKSFVQIDDTMMD